MILRAETITFAYQPGRPVLRDLSLTLAPGQVTAVFGPNGCGKSTLLRCLNGTLRPQQGQVWLDDRPVTGLSRRELARQIAVVAQETPVDLPLSVAEVVMLGRHPHRACWQAEGEADWTAVAAAMREAEVFELAGRPFAQLSGGERQRVVIARALAQQPRIVLLDEPATHLDLRHQLDLYRLARQWAAAEMAVLLIGHDLYMAPNYADVAVLMQEGRVVAAGAVAEVLAERQLEAVFGCRRPAAWQPAASG